ncbi:MAG: DAK2 domain-containing protein [Actinobacteria bacterium]|nr:DAK2 domain-containing protein [Actinomycetota bacterium]
MNGISTAVEVVASALITHAPTFEKLDAAAGDGDLGITAGKIAEGMRTANAAATGDLKVDLMLIGREIAKAAPSTFGTLFATGFIRAAAVVTTDADALSNTQGAIAAAFDGIAARGKAGIGERTLLDALYPAVVALKNATDLPSGLSAAARAARAGVAATAEMAPKHGRAGWIGERVKGLEDAGATVVAVIFEALAE